MQFLNFRRATLDKYSEDIAVAGRHIQQTLGFTPRFDLTTGWQDAIKRMREPQSARCKE